MSTYAAIILPAHLMMKFPVDDEERRVVGVCVVHGDQQTSRKCYVADVFSFETHKKTEEQRGEEDEEVELERRKGKEPRIA